MDGIHHIAMRTAAAEGKRGELQASLGGCRVRDELHGLTVSGGELPVSIQTNTEPYIQGEWRRTPYEARCAGGNDGHRHRHCHAHITHSDIKWFDIVFRRCGSPWPAERASSVCILYHNHNHSIVYDPHMGKDML